jgi:hypothetical protein
VHGAVDSCIAAATGFLTALMIVSVYATTVVRLTSQDDQLMTVLDVGGLGMSTLKNNKVCILQYLCAVLSCLQYHGMKAACF